ncbi:MAG TPA: MFS transporter [Micropepsaceae bacterium]|nr:MFS transporter [Micropepsaceae bacterium]
MTADARTLLREGPMSVFQIMVVVICTFLNMIDGFDVLAISFTAPVIAKEWGVNPATLGILLSAGLAGMALGSLALSPVADLIGRRTVVLLSTAIISIGMLGSAAASNVWELAGLRFLTGLGVGGVLASGNTLLSEYASDRWRDLSISAMVVGYPAGAIIGGSISAYLIGAFGWRSAFIFGGLSSTALLPVLLYLPESIDFLLAHNADDTLARVNRVMRRLGHPPMSALPQIAPEEKSTRAVIGVFDAQFLKGTLLICLTFFMLMLSFYFVLSWTPKNMVDLGFTVQQGIFASVLLNLGGILGGLTFGYLAGKSHARKLAPYLFVALFLGIVGFGALHAGLMTMMTGAFSVGFFLIGCMASLYAIVPRIYPASVRNTGTGLAIGFGRLGAVIGPYLGGLLIAASWQRLAYYSVLALPVLISAVAVRRIPFFGERPSVEGAALGRGTLRPAQ